MLYFVITKIETVTSYKIISVPDYMYLQNVSFLLPKVEEGLILKDF